MSRILFLIFFTVLISFMEVYIYNGINSAFKDGLLQKSLLVVQGVSIVITLGAILTMMTLFSGGLTSSSLIPNLLIGLTFTFFFTKLVLLIFFLGEDIYRGARFVVENIVGAVAGDEKAVEVEGRRKFIGQLGLATAAIPFSTFLYGVVRGKYNFQVRNITLTFPDLPQGFDGFKIAQISDVHSGSFDSTSAVRSGIEMIQKQNPDLILFTGDMVNNVASEIEPYMDFFKNLTAPYGKFSVLGNHDYGDYIRWNSIEEKRVNLRRLMDHHHAMGFQLMNNTSVRLEKDGEGIRLAGVENWGQRPFPQHGDLTKAFEGAPEHEFTVLMSHDPSHWDEQILDFPKKVHLTLSGHTHGMQMGVEIKGFRWSPVKYRYPRWAGLYNKNDQNLYVNRGFGFIGFPGRVGIWPEITVFELKSSKA